MKRYEVKIEMIVEADDATAALATALAAVHETPAIKELSTSLPVEQDHVSAGQRLAPPTEPDPALRAFQHDQ